MRCIDLFAGAGGLSEGFRRVPDFDIIAHVEMDYAASLTLKTREAFYYLKNNGMLNVYIDYISGRISRDELYSNIPEHVLSKVINIEISNDTRNEIFHRIDSLREGNPIDIIIGGPPCQAYSIAGRSRDPYHMLNDPRNFLYQQYLTFIENYTPSLFVFENVIGLLSAHGGNIFANIQNDMEALGYHIDFRILNSAHFNVPQRRQRIILIGWHEDIDFYYPNFNIPNLNITVGTMLNNLPALQAGESINFMPYNELEDRLFHLHIVNPEFPYLIQHISRPNNERDLEIYRLYVEAWNNRQYRLRYNELPPHLITHNNTTNFLDRFKVVPENDVCHTVVAHIAKDGHYYIHPDILQNRSISVREAARLQTFPDDYFFESSRTSAFKQIGNAVPPLLAEYIAREIAEQLA